MHKALRSCRTSPDAAGSYETPRDVWCRAREPVASKKQGSLRIAQKFLE